jgi:hypothetical protein
VGKRKPGGGSPPQSRSSITIRPIGRDEFELAHPRCVEDRELDYEEAIEILDAGEPDVAREVLIDALEGCGDNLWIHAALGRIALEGMRNPSLARGHYGYVLELVERALPPGFRGRLPRSLPANRPLFEAAEGLAASLEALGTPAEASEVRAKAARWAGHPG